MYVPGCEFKNSSGDVEGNWGKCNGIIVKFEADIDIKGCGVYSVSVGNNCFCAFV